EMTTKLTGRKLDILVNNVYFYPAYVTTATDYMRVKVLFDTNLFGVMRMVEIFVNLLIASGNGHILQIGSIVAVIPLLFSSMYNTSKAALLAYSNTLSVELMPFKYMVLEWFLMLYFLIGFLLASK
ncbi:hypothetical protein PILCRDRAFT_59773, partial [Piloderma croceum F 1598]